jgi:protein TonB
MNTKKSEKSNLENKKTLFFEIGLTLALSTALIAFEWATPDPADKTQTYMGYNLFEEELEIQITRPEVERVTKPPALPEINIVEDDYEVPDVDINLDVDAGENTRIFIPELPDEAPVEDPVVYFADKMPRYRGGDLTLFRDHMQMIVNYPAMAVDLGLQGTVFAQFVVDKNGNVTDIKITRGIDPLLDNEVIAAIKKSERWEAGEQTGRKVKVGMSIPIIFRLQ